MLNYKQNKTPNREQPKKHPDQICKLSTNRAPIIGPPPPHLLLIPSTLQQQIMNTKRSISQIPQRKSIKQSQSAYQQWLLRNSPVDYSRCKNQQNSTQPNSRTSINLLKQMSVIALFFPLPKWAPLNLRSNLRRWTKNQKIQKLSIGVENEWENLLIRLKEINRG